MEGEWENMDQAFKKDESLTYETEAQEELNLFSAAKKGELEKVNRLVDSGVNVNSLDDHQNLAVDYAWTNKFHDVVLLLLKTDSKFPKQFNLAQLNEGNESAHLKNFVEERNLLHECIVHDNLEEVQKLVNKCRSKFYYNEKNNSAAYVAVKSKKFNISAYLKSIGVDFSSETEKQELDNLKLKDQFALKDALVYHFPAVSGAHIHNLISKSRSQGPIEGLTNKLHDYYSKLDQIPKISTILKVNQHADFLDIVFDFDEENVARVNPTVPKSTKGETNYKAGRLYIAASPKRGERKILGTIAHELTHMAMQILFENECNPYLANDTNRVENFDKITKKVLSSLKKFDNNPSEVILNVKKGYRVEDHHCELIVTVPQILVEYEYGGDWLQELVPELLHFYMKIIIPECHEFIEKSVILKVKTEIKKFNETSGQIIQLKKSTVIFGNLDLIDFLNTQNKNIFIFRTRNTLLGTMKILQSIFGENYINSYDKYLFVAFSAENVTPPLKDLLGTFYLETCDTLVIRCTDDSYEKVLEAFLEGVWDIFQRKPNKKLIFVVNPNVEEFLLQMLKNLMMWCVCAEKMDGSTSLNDLSEKSRNEISSKKVIFQGGEIALNEMIAADENIYKLVTGDAIENLIQGNKFLIGEKPFDHNNLRGFSYVDEEINLRTFIDEFKKSKDVFAIKGVNDKDELIEHFSELIKKRIIRRDVLARHVIIINPECFEIGSKRLVLADEFSEENFQTLCRHNWDKKIYFIAVEGAKFILKQLYNPNFYLERRFKVMINQDKLINLISKLPSETFIISTDSHRIELNKNYENVKMVEIEDAESVFNGMVKDKTTVHWFHVQDRKEIYWKKSSGLSSNSWLDFTNLKTNDECMIEEDDVIKHVADKKVMIIADNPGMGKSTTLTKLYESALIAPTHWVIRIDLKGHAKSIREINSNDLSIKEIIDFLKKIKYNFDNKLPQDLLESALILGGKFTTHVLFAFDGFDELLDNPARNTITALLNYLRKNTRSKIWITTRLHYKSLLEEALSTFAYQFDPIDDESKGIYVRRFLQERLKVTFEPELAEDIFDPKKYSKVQFYTEKFLGVMKFVFSKNVTTFIGTPLQLYLMTENSVKHFKNWIEENAAVVNFSHLGNNILTVYQNFIDGKYEIYFKKQNITEDYMKDKAKEEAEEYHKVLAEALTRNKQLSRKHKKDTPLMLLIGLIQSGDEDNLEFIHFTFREYFAALIFKECISDESSDFEQKLKYLAELLENKEFWVIRNFINLLLGNLNFEELPEENLDSFREKLVTSGSELSTTTKQILCNSVKEGHGNILDFILFTCENDFNDTSYQDMLTMDCEDDYILLHSAISNADQQITEILFKKIEKLPTEDQKEILRRYSKYGTIFEMAVFSTCTPIVKIVLQRLETVLELNELQLLLKEILLDHPSSILFGTKEICPAITHRSRESLLHFLAKTGNNEMMMLVLEKVQELFLPEEQKEIIMIENDGDQNILFVAIENGRIELAKILLAKLEDISSAEELIDLIGRMCRKYPFLSVKRENVVHLAARRGYTELVEIFFEKYKNISWEKQFITMKNGPSQTLCHIATQKGHVELMKMLIGKMDEILSAAEQMKLIKKQVGNDQTVLHLAAKSGNAEVMKTWLEKCENMLPEDRKKIIMMQNLYFKTIFHVAVQKSNIEVIKIILEKIDRMLSTEAKEEVITMVDNNSQTVLHLAVANENVEIVKIILDAAIKILSLEKQEEFIMMTDYYTETALYLAAENGNSEILTLLLEKSKEISSPKEYIMIKNFASKNLFHVISEKGHAKLLRTLLTKASEIFSTEELKGIMMKKVRNDENILHLAARSGNFEILTIWLERLSREEQREMVLMKNKFSRNILYIAAENDHNGFIKALLEEISQMLSVEEQKEFIFTMSNKSDYSDEKRGTVVHLAARRNNPELMDLLFEKSKEISSEKEFLKMENSSSKTAFHIASRNHFYRAFATNTRIKKMLIAKMSEILSVEEQDEIIKNANKSNATHLG